MVTVRKYRDRCVADLREPLGRRRIEAPKVVFERKALERRAAQEVLTQRLSDVRSG